MKVLFFTFTYMIYILFIYIYIHLYIYTFIYIYTHNKNDIVYQSDQKVNPFDRPCTEQYCRNSGDENHISFSESVQSADIYIGYFMHTHI